MHSILRRIRAVQVRVGARPRQRSRRGAGGALSRRRVLALLFMVAAGWVALAVYREGAQSGAADARVNALQQQNAALRTEIDQRRREIAQAGSDSWLAEEARRLGYVRDGEQVFVPTSSTPRVAGGGVDSGPVPTFSATGSPSASPSTAPASAPPGSGPPSATPIVVVPGGR